MCRRYGQAGIPLPNELLSVIINKLASDTEDNDIARAALASCRLTSHVLCSLATPLFFSSMKLTEKLSWANYEDRLETFRARAIKLNQLLTIRDIAASVHTLALRCGEVALTEGTLISRILYRLPHIRCLTFETDHQLEFSLITKGFSSAIHALFKSPNLTTLNLYYVRNFPITDITPNLRCLRLSFTVSCVNNVNPMDETSSPQPFYLDSLEIDQFSLYSLGVSISHDKSFAKYFSQIKNLQLKDLFSVDALRLGWDIMLLTSQCLATLDLSWNNELYLESELVPYDLGRLPALRHFKIQLPSSFPSHMHMLSFLQKLLSISSSTSGIETLEIKITWSNGREKDLFSSDAGWSTLDEVLTGENFPSLRKLILDFCLFACDDHHNKLDYKNFILSYVNALFPMFKSLTSRQCTLETYVEIC